MDTYTILNVIGEGSFGRALLVQCRNESDKYVLKEIRLPKADDKMHILRKEAILLARMKHQNIVAFRDSFEDDGHLYIVMEYCAGGDLLQKLKWQKGSLLPEDLILRWFVQICLATKYIHEQKVLHRDIKSKNIFLTSDGTIKLGDFGSACILNSSKAYACSYVGTPYYVSPEIWENKPYNNKSDVWALGCVLYELCTLKHPFQANSWKSLILKICRGSYPPLPAHYPYELHYLIKQIFKINPKDRPSVNTILSRHRISRFLKNFLPRKNSSTTSDVELKKLPHVYSEDHKASEGCIPVESNQEFKEERQHRNWRKSEGEMVVKVLSQKTLEEGTCNMEVTPEGPHVIFPESSRGPTRKYWDEDQGHAVLDVLKNADFTSSGRVYSGDLPGSHVLLHEENLSRKQWTKEPPKEVLNLFENASLNLAFETYTIYKPASENLLVGPLSPPRGDDTDGAIDNILDSSRLDPRSDDEDTDFEEEPNTAWIAQFEKMVKEQKSGT
ncbi:serine/threonine-protein kinase Nek3 [Polypterus senegalus]|uniref:serine/threonine-protein kinase Nek3 n=1 Tax=Polypterus senegalus TaxID=55291 RepID=UPI001963312D|nr:serine/threonine-protein kinase Nek3 [Polypterus senegalus]